jgi:hypothetical protein
MIKQGPRPDAAAGLLRGELDRVKRIGELIATGAKRSVIEERVGVSGPDLDGLLKRAGEGSLTDYERMVTVRVVRESFEAGKTAKQAAKKLGLSLGALLNRVGGSVAGIKADVARKVTAEMLAAGKSEAEVMKALGIKTESTLDSRLATGGTTLDAMYSQAGVQRGGASVDVELSKKTLQEVSIAVERHLRKRQVVIPPGAERTWAKRGNPDSAGYYREVFRQLVDGETPAAEDAEYRRARGVVLPEVKQQLKKDAKVILGLLKAPAFSPQEIEVFRHTAVGDLTGKEVGAKLDVSESWASHLKSSLISKAHR